MYADGDVLFAHGHRRIQAATSRIAPPGLFLMSCHCLDPKLPVQASGVTVAPGFQEMVMLASVPLTEDGGVGAPWAKANWWPCRQDG